MTRADDFEEQRPVLFAIAHRILGSESRAHDAVRETGSRWQTSGVPSAAAEAYLPAEVARISAEALRSAESSSALALLTLERMSPLERAVCVLREVFAYSLPDIASAVGCSEAACRRLAATLPAAGDDSGPVVAWPRRVTGAENVARLLAATIPPLVQIGITVEQHRVRGRPGAIFRDRNGKILDSALALDIVDGRIHTILLVPSLDVIGQ